MLLRYSDSRSLSFSFSGQASETKRSRPVTQALDCLMNLGWEDYDGQVVEFLDANSREEFGGKPAWELLQNQVLNELEANA